MLGGILLLLLIVVAISVSVRSCQSRAAEAEKQQEAAKAAAQQEEENNTLHLLAVGDNYYHDAILAQGEAAGWNFDSIYENVKDEIGQADLAVVNQEVPLVSDPADASGYPKFGTPLAGGEALVSAGFALVTNEFQFLVLRVLLGIAEAGFMPAIVYYFTLWFTEERRSSIMGLFWMGPPLAFIFGSPISGLLLDMHGFLGHEGWQWMFAIEGLLAAVSGVFAFRYLIDEPKKAKWLTDEEKIALKEALDKENSKKSFEK